MGQQCPPCTHTHTQKHFSISISVMQNMHLLHHGDGCLVISWQSIQQQKMTYVCAEHQDTHMKYYSEIREGIMAVVNKCFIVGF